MNLARCDECCAKLNGINGDTVYPITNKATWLFNEGYEHLCEDCMDDKNIDEEKLFINKDGQIDLIKDKMKTSQNRATNAKVAYSETRGEQS